MKKILFLFLATVSLTSCEKDVEFNNPAMQGRMNNSFFSSGKIIATKGISGNFEIVSMSAIGTITLNTSSTAPGTYVLGTTNQSNGAYYSVTKNNATSNFGTTLVQAPVNRIALSNGGSGYEVLSSVETTGGSGTGLKIDIKSISASGGITSAVVSASGNGYKAGDLISVVGGNSNATFYVQNVTKSNGEIVISKYDGATITGTYKFIAVDEETGEIAACRDGVFYQIPVN